MSEYLSGREEASPRTRVKTAWFILVSLALATAAIGDNFEILRSTIDGGGVIFSIGDDYELSGTIGQPDAGTMSGGDFTVSGGFWFPLAPADCNVDGGVDLYDYATFEACMSGPGGAVPEPFCSCFDLDGDGNVDLEDLAELQCSFSG